MEFNEVLMIRESIRHFIDKPIEPKKLEYIIACAESGPSAGNLMAYDIHVITDKELMKKIAFYSLNQIFIADASAVLIFCSWPEKSTIKYGTRGELYSLQDATIAATIAQLAIVESGLGSCWVGAFHEKEIIKVCKIPEGQIPIVVMPVGHYIYNKDTEMIYETKKV